MQLQLGETVIACGVLFRFQQNKIETFFFLFPLVDNYVLILVTEFPVLFPLRLLISCKIFIPLKQTFLMKWQLAFPYLTSPFPIILNENNVCYKKKEKELTFCDAAPSCLILNYFSWFIYSFSCLKLLWPIYWT